jgi:hypothetical protein
LIKMTNAPFGYLLADDGPRSIAHLMDPQTFFWAVVKKRII